MDQNSYKLAITTNLNKTTVDQLINELSAVAVERDALKTEVAALKSRLSPKPEDGGRLGG